MSEQKAGSCQIHLKPESLHRAWEALYLRTVTENEELGLDSVKAREQARSSLESYIGPHFKDCVLEVDFRTPGWVHVTLRDLTAYSYPMSDVARVKSYKSE